MGQQDVTTRLAVTEQVGERALPADINSLDAQPLKGPFVLQVTSAEDITKAPKGGGNNSKHR